MTDKIKEIIDRYPWLLMVVPIAVVIIFAFVFLSGKKTNSPAGITPTVMPASPVSNNQVATPSKNTTSPFNPLAFILSLIEGKKAPEPTGSIAPTAAPLVNTSPTTAIVPTQAVSNTSTGSTASIAQTIQKLSSPGVQISQVTTTSTPSQPIPIIFKTSDGGTQEYTPPGSPPVDVIWARYTNLNDRYSIEFPANWQVIRTQYNGHEGLSVYAPGANIDDPNVQYIGFGIANYYLLPQGNEQGEVYSYPISTSGINGTMYTQGVLGTGSMAVVFQYAQGSFGLGSSVSEPNYIYVYNYMLQSLQFGPQ